MYVSNPRRRKRRSSRKRRKNPFLKKRRSTRRRRRNPARSGGGGGLGGFTSGLKSLVNKDNILTAAGVGMGIGLSRYILPKFTPVWNETKKAYEKKTGQTFTLPGVETDIGGYLYMAGLGALGAMLTRRLSPAISRGLLISGPVAAAVDLSISAILNVVKATKGTEAYLDGPRVRGMGRLQGPQNHSAIAMFSALPEQRQNAFQGRFAVR